MIVNNGGSHEGRLVGGLQGVLTGQLGTLKELRGDQEVLRLGGWRWWWS